MIDRLLSFFRMQDDPDNQRHGATTMDPHDDADDHHHHHRHHDRLRRVVATGLEDRENEVLVRVAEAATAAANVVFFPGDVQDFRDNMLRGAYADYATYAYEEVAEHLAAKFGPDANVIIVRPSRLEYGAYACFDHFVEGNKYGAVPTFSGAGTGIPHLMALLEGIRESLVKDDGGTVRLHTHLPLHLVGFSKGATVLNQVCAEMVRWRSSWAREDDLVENQDAETANGNWDRQFFLMLSSLHWLDPGNGSCHGAVPTDDTALSSLQLKRSLQLCIYTTPYQFESPDRPWIKAEITQLVSRLKHQPNVAIFLSRYFDDELGSLESHFRLLEEFSLPHILCPKTGITQSPEVSVLPYRIQTF